MNGSELSRRRFLIRCGHTLVVGGAGAGLLAWAYNDSPVRSVGRGREFARLQQARESDYISAILRPPGAVEEYDFVSRCIKCMKCGQACPLGAIRFLSSAWGRSFGTPVVIPGVRACDMCVYRERLQCVAACPTDALAPVAVNDVEMGKAKVNRETCFEHRDVRKCSICHKVCPVRTKVTIQLDPESPRVLYDTGFLSEQENRTLTKIETHRAIEKDLDDRPTVTEDRCIGCGRCEEECPEPRKAIRVRAGREILV